MAATEEDYQRTVVEDDGAVQTEGVPEEYYENAMGVIEETLDELSEFVDAWREKTTETAENVCEESVSNRTHWRADFVDDPIALNGEGKENIRVEDLVSCENALLSKSTMILAHLGGEVRRLGELADESIYPLLATFGERADEEAIPTDKYLREAFVGKLQALQDCLLFMEQMRAAIFNLFTQVSVIHSTFGAYTPYQAVRLSWSYDMLGRALAIALGLDEVVKNNKNLSSALMTFKQAVLLIRSNPEQFSMNEVDITSLDAAISIVEKQLFTCSFFSAILEQLAGTQQSDRFIRELAGTTSELLGGILTRLNTQDESLCDKRSLTSCLCLTILHSRLVPDIVDRKLCADAWKVHETCILLPCSTTVCVCPGFILDAYLSPKAQSYGPVNGMESVSALRRETLATLDETLPTLLRGLTTALVAWLAKFTAAPKIKMTSLSSTMEARASLYQSGLSLVTKLRHYIQEIIHLHVSLEAPMTKHRVHLVAQGVELLQTAQDVLTQNVNTRSETQHVQKSLVDRIIRMTVPAQELLENTLATTTSESGWSRLKSHISSGKTENNKQDTLANIRMAVDVLSGPVTQKRLDILRICMDAILGASVLNSADADAIPDLISLAEALATYRKSVHNACDTSFLFLTRELFPICLSQIYSNPDESGRLPVLLSAFRSCETLLMRAGANVDEMAQLQNYFEMHIESEIIQPLCRDIETDLRLHLHSARIMGVANTNPLKDGVRDLSAFVNLPPLRMLNYQIDIRNRVEDYLNRMFHNHTAIALHNWKSYVEMRNLAIEKYGLTCAEIELPSQTLEQGLDVLELMRNIHVFVARYNYNLNTQCFVEKSSAAADRKHLNTISIRHVANSIRTHGTGITHTTINFAYQYLAQRFQVLNQFLFDDHIRSYLLKEARAVHAETKAKSDAIKRNSKQAGYRTSTVDDKFQYPVERALRLLRDIRKLGTLDNGMSFIDQFRSLVTEIGNALGFVRMLRLGAMHYSTNAAKFAPSSQALRFSADEAITIDDISEHTKRALKNLQDEIEALGRGGTDGTDYFQVLVSVFSTELQNKGKEHLNDFYLILPALTMSAAETILASKDKLTRRGKDSHTASFTDDGLALGIVYLLSVLGQHEAFDALHWFESATKHFDTERKQANEEKSEKFGILGPTADEKMKLQAKLDRIDAIQHEFAHLKYSLTGARTFVNF